MQFDKHRLIGAATDTLTAGPMSIYLDINTACQLKCNFCWIHSPLQKTRCRSKDLPFNVIARVVDAAVAWGSREITIAGDGEPTLHPRFKDIASCIRERNIHTRLTTNAAFPERLLPTIANIDHVYVNFSAPNKKLYEQVHSPGRPELFDVVLRNLKVLASFAKKHKRPLLNIAYIINRTNFRSIPEAVELATTLGVAKVSFRMMESTPQTRRLLLTPAEKKELVRVAGPLCRRALPFDHDLASIEHALREPKTNPYRIARCFTGWYSLLVDFNQNVGICCHNEKLIIGNMTKSALKDIWESRRAHALRLKCKHHFDIRRAPFKGECEWCHWANVNHAIDQELQKPIYARHH